jgi:signal transduction histidine kinase
VFEDFEQVDNTRARNHEGIGLGLPLSRRLATLMGGRLPLKSQFGSGTDFILSLPVGQGSTSEPQSAATAA